MPPSQQKPDLFDVFVASLADTLAARLKQSAPATRATASAAPSRGTKRRKGQKRTSADLAEMTSALLGYIKAKPGQRIEQIASAMRVSTTELKLPAQKLLAGKAVKTKGQRRGTHYFAA